MSGVESKSTELEKVKRPAGQLQGNEWLVITESTWKKDERIYTHSCGETIVEARIAHPIWDGPFPESGSGRCSYETWPYCPRCEEEPNFHGEPIDLRKMLWPEVGA